MSNLFRKRPMVIEAFCWMPVLPDWALSAMQEGKMRMGRSDRDIFLAIDTLGGVMTGSRGDWIIRGIRGEIYPCKADIFEATYEPYLSEPE